MRETGHDLIELNKPAGEGIVIPSDVSFAVMGSSMMAHGLRYSERAILASKIISLDYLWNVVRVKGRRIRNGFRGKGERICIMLHIQRSGYCRIH